MGCRPLEELDEDSRESMTQGGASGESAIETQGKMIRTAIAWFHINRKILPRSFLLSTLQIESLIAKPRLPWITISKVGTLLLFADSTCLQDSHRKDKCQCLRWATVFLYFDSNISELQQSSVREHLRFQGATISEFYHKKVNIVLLNRSATKKQKRFNIKNILITRCINAAKISR